MKKPISFYIKLDLLKIIDAYRHHIGVGVSRSEVINTAIEEYLDRLPKKKEKECMPVFGMGDSKDSKPIITPRPPWKKYTPTIW